MSDYIPIKTNSTLSFDISPNEILVLIFNYLTSNEIIYSFFNINQRLQHLLFTQKYHFILPKMNLNFWKQVLPIIGSRITTLIIEDDCLPLSLDFFPNSRSIIITSPYSLLDGQLLSVVNHPCFRQLSTLKIKESILLDRTYGTSVLDDEQILFQTIFDDNNTLEVFEYLPLLDSFYYRKFGELKPNMSIRSLTLNFTDFKDIYTLIQYTPNLIYLNVQSERPLLEFEVCQSTDTNRIKLEEFYFKCKPWRSIRHKRNFPNVNLKQLCLVIHLFSSSLMLASTNIIL